MQLDERARSASDALVQSVAVDESLSGTPVRSRRTRAVAIAVAVVLIAVGAVAVVNRKGHTTVTVGGGSGAVPRLIAPQPPAGLSATGATDLPARDSIGSSEVLLFAPNANATLATSSIALVAVRSVENMGHRQTGDEDVDVSGHAGWIDHQGDLFQVIWPISDTIQAQVIAAGISPDDAIAAARSATITDTQVTMSAPPAGLVEIGHAGNLAYQGGIALLLRNGGRGAQVAYQSSDSTKSLFVTTFEGDDAVSAVQRFYWAPHAVRAQVRGHEGWVAEEPNGTVAALWQEAPGVYVTVIGFGVDRTTLVATAEDLRPASDAEWNALKALAPSQGGVVSSSSSSFSTVGSPLPPKNAIGSVDGEAGGIAYVVWLDADRNLGVTYSGPGTSGHGSAGQDPQRDLGVPYARLQLLDDYTGLAYGRVPLFVAAVRVVFDNGNPAQGGIYTFKNQGFGLFALSFQIGAPLDPNTSLNATVIFLDSAGNELSRMPVSSGPA